jgi:hypothetical protein
MDRLKVAGLPALRTALLGLPEDVLLRGTVWHGELEDMVHGLKPTINLITINLLRGSLAMHVSDIRNLHHLNLHSLLPLDLTLPVGPFTQKEEDFYSSIPSCGYQSKGGNVQEVNQTIDLLVFVPPLENIEVSLQVKVMIFKGKIGEVKATRIDAIVGEAKVERHDCDCLCGDGTNPSKLLEIICIIVTSLVPNLESLDIDQVPETTGISRSGVVMKNLNLFTRKDKDPLCGLVCLPLFRNTPKAAEKFFDNNRFGH